MNNQSLIAKADVTLAELSANGGELPPTVARTFIRRLIDTPTLLKQARVIEMPSAQYKAPRIQFASRILRAATQGTALTQSQRSKVTTTEIELNAKEVIASVFVPYDVMEEAVEQANLNLTDAQRQANNGNAPTDGIRDTIVELIAERAAVDLEELGLKGDTGYTSGDADDQAYLSLFDGFLARALADGNVFNQASATINSNMFRDGLKALPNPYHRNKTAMRHFLSVDQELNYRSVLAARATGLGDSMVTADQAVMAYGVPLETVHLMPETQGLLTNPKNLVYGIRRKINMEFDKNIHTRVYEIVLTARIDVTVEEERAIVLYNNIG
jgi:hypothetical protein